MVEKYSDSDFEVSVSDGVLRFKSSENWKAMAVILE